MVRIEGRRGPLCGGGRLGRLVVAQRLVGDHEGVRLRLGLARPWRGAVVAEPAEWSWRHTLAGASGTEYDAWRLEVPPGLLPGDPGDTVEPGV